MIQSRTETLLLMLMGIVILLMAANVGLFLRMNQLQREVLAALKPYQELTRGPSGLEVGAPAPPFSLRNTEGESVLADRGAPETRKFLRDPVRTATSPVTILPSHKVPSEGAIGFQLNPGGEDLAAEQGGLHLLPGLRFAREPI